MRKRKQYFEVQKMGERKEKLERSSKYQTEAVFSWELLRGQGGANRARSVCLCQTDLTNRKPSIDRPKRVSAYHRRNSDYWLTDEQQQQWLQSPPSSISKAASTSRPKQWGMTLFFRVPIDPKPLSIKMIEMAGLQSTMSSAPSNAQKVVRAVLLGFPLLKNISGGVYE